MMHDPYRDWLHPQTCDCDSCAPYQPEPLAPIGAVAMARLALTGFCASAGLCALYDPHATLVALAAITGIAL